MLRKSTQSRTYGQMCWIPNTDSKGLGLQIQCQHEHADVSAEAQCGEEQDAVITGAKLGRDPPVVVSRAEELLVALIPAIYSAQDDSHPIDGEECADGVELRSEDSEYDQGEAELRESGPHISSLERSLCRPDLNKLLNGQRHRPSTM